MFFVFGREKKCVESVQLEQTTWETFLFLVRGMLGAICSPNMHLKAATLQGLLLAASFDRVDLDILENILIS